VQTSSKSSFKENCILQGVITNLNPSTIITDLRKVVNHPYMVQMPLIPGTEEPLIDENLVNIAGKMLVLDAMLAKLKATGHKVRNFSTQPAIAKYYFLLPGSDFFTVGVGVGFHRGFHADESLQLLPFGRQHQNC